MAEPKEGCVRPVGGPIVDKKAEAPQSTSNPREAIMTARIGQPAPDFQANGHLKDKFQTFQLSQFKGQWIVLCFYPGDFTFV